MIPPFIRPLIRNGYFLMEIKSWEMWRGGIDENGNADPEERRSFSVAMASIGVDEELIRDSVWGDKILLTIRDRKK